MVPVARRNLFAEKGRFAISVAGVSFAVLLILIVIALYRGWSRTGEVFQQLPGQVWVTQQGTSDPFHSVSLLEPEELAGVRQVEGVEGVVPVLSRQMTIEIGGSEESARLMALNIGPGMPVDAALQRDFLPAEGQISIEKTLSRKTGLDIGDSAVVGGVPLTVTNVRPAGHDVISQFVFVNFSDARRIFGVAGVVNFGLVSVKAGASPAEVKSRIDAALPGVTAFTSEEFAGLVRKEIDESFIPVIAILVAIGFVVGAAVVGLTIYTATIERTREFGVMKAVGASPRFLYRIVLSQSAVLTAAGFLVGLGAAVVTARLAAQAVPEFTTDFQVRDIAAVLVAAGVMSLIASFMPVRRINSIDPAGVFRA